MKAASINEVKKELQDRDKKELIEFCLGLARFKKENKEFLDYLLFEADDRQGYLERIKEEMDEQFILMRGQSNLYYTKKTLRKVLRTLNKYNKFIGDKSASIELHIYFCLKLKRSGIPFHESKLIVNMYEQQIKKIQTMINGLHEDLRMDYQNELEQL